LEKLAASWRTHPKYSRIEIILKSSLPAATTIQAQETEFIDVLETLISNSARALSNLPDGRKPIIQIQAQLVDNKCELIFEDNGSGIPTELLTELGEIPVVGQETGIGAWLAAATIRNDMQGTIEWQNIAPYGTQVKICLSALQQEHQLDGEDEYHETTSDSLL
jgi:C4-dicarboxylate-specific signal transduction histidine kinase